jgi:hypothetical protein
MIMFGVYLFSLMFFSTPMAVAERLEKRFPYFRQATKATDVATPSLQPAPLPAYTFPDSATEWHCCFSYLCLVFFAKVS